MIEHISTRERDFNPKPELIAYGDGEYAFVYDKPGAEVSFSAGREKLNPENQSFDTTDDIPGTMVALTAIDYDGNKAIFVAGTGYEDLVCQFDIVNGKTSYTIFEDPNFNTALAAKPMTIGARHDRLGDRKLTKVYALPRMQINNDTSSFNLAPEGVSSPLGIASRLFQEYLAR